MLSGPAPPAILSEQLARKEDTVHEAVRIIKDEHRSIAAVLHGLLYLTRETHERGTPPDFQVLRAMLDYIVSFPEKLHHPKEDRYLFETLRERSDEAGPLIDELEGEHVLGDHLLRRLQSALIAYQSEGTVKADAFRAVVEEYADFHWAHMRREEDELLPLAEKALTESDWKTIAAAFKENDDPLFGIKPKEELQQLFRRVVTLAPPPIGVGPPRA
jgi:hemerythrin-like domain-containing protein